MQIKKNSYEAMLIYKALEDHYRIEKENYKLVFEDKIESESFIDLEYCAHDFNKLVSTIDNLKNNLVSKKLDVENVFNLQSFCADDIPF